MVLGESGMTEIDLMTTPLEIKTDSAVGSNDLMYVRLLDAETKTAMIVQIRFEEPIKYQLMHCMASKQPLSNVPTEQDKVWKIIRTLDRVKIECNGVMVTDFNIDSCTEGLKGVYKRIVAKVSFADSDKASDFFRQIGLQSSILKKFLHKINEFCFFIPHSNKVISIYNLNLIEKI